MKKLIIKLIPIIDITLSPFVLVSAIVLKLVRRLGLSKVRLSRSILLRVGVLPINDHYYEPLFHPKHLFKPLSDDRHLPGINLNTNEQLSILDTFDFNSEIIEIPDDYVDNLTFHFKNGSFESGDADYWYNLIRIKKPKTIIEIGSGHSTKMAQLAIRKNKQNNENYVCNHICIEPYEMPWLEKLNDIQVLRKKVESVDIDFFKKLNENDILFIDSSHIIRPQGDVLFEFLEILPTLNKGVIVHIHDIFTPKDYLEEWVTKHHKLWNEQYLLEAFLTSNSQWSIIGALNYLKNNHFEALKNKCPKLDQSREPGSFYIQKI